MHCTIPNTLHTLEDFFPFYRKEKLAVGFRFGGWGTAFNLAKGPDSSGPSVLRILSRHGGSGAGGGGGNIPFVVSKTQARSKPRTACLREYVQRRRVGENNAHTLCHPRLHMCYRGYTYSTAGFIIIWWEDVAYCQEQILSDTWVIVRDWGEWVGRKALGSRAAESM